MEDDSALDWQFALRMPGNYKDRLEGQIPALGGTVAAVLRTLITDGLVRAERQGQPVAGLALSED